MAAKADRRKYLHEEIASGEWAVIRRMRRGPPKKSADLKDPAGKMVTPKERGDTMAQYLETIQWQVRFPTLVPTNDNVIHDDLEISDFAFCIQELQRVLQQLKCGKTRGYD